ncbi:hypothetical protein [Chitinivibrio alkaliphilus]|uniref:Uncharacterized protein n=1 Tax=Chitinivibrio alkaliphilus ACht1 TaxID=1313304 RepID=U7D882_9BACT|nr:hypothetical protein [Chitinivibrio alkaliphilus]ERP39165.1 hypothetical protein CALK_0335 [Chitinivibrio alkaliphilus ACht1]
MAEDLLIIAGTIFLLLLAISILKGVLRLLLPIVILLACILFVGPRLGWFEEEDLREHININQGSHIYTDSIPPLYTFCRSRCGGV